MITLLPHCGYLSETTRMLEIHRALTARGAPARIATHGGTYEHLLGRPGTDYDRIDPPLSPDRSQQIVRTSIGTIHGDLYTDDEIRTHTHAEAAYFHRTATTVAVTGFTLTTHLSTRVVGIPLVTEHGGSWIPPVFERRLMPAPTPGPLLPRTYRLLPPPLRRRIFTDAAPRARTFTAAFNRIATELGVPTVPNITALLTGDLTLVPESPDVLGIPPAELHAWRPDGNPAHRPGTRLHYTGPLHAHLDIPIPPHVAKALHGDRPLIYVAITSTGADLIRAVVTHLSRLDARILVAGTRHTITDLDAERVTVGGVLPSHLVMPHADLAVTAGGQGSVQTAMATGTPLLGIPLQPEQDLNLALVERLGAARHLSPRHARTRRIATLAARMLTDPAYRRAARAIQHTYATCDGPGAAADAILNLAATGAH